MKSFGKYVLWFVLLAAVTSTGLYFMFSPRQVEVVEPEKGNMDLRVSGPGNIEADVGVRVSPRISGQIEKLEFKEGQEVSRGEIMALLDDSTQKSRLKLAKHRLEEARLSLLSARADQDKALADLALAKWNYSRDYNLWNKDHIDKAALEKSKNQKAVARARQKAANASLQLSRQKVNTLKQELEYQQIQLSFTRVKSPIKGLVTSREADEGETVSPDKTIYTVIDRDSLQIAARIEESLTGPIKKGQEAEVELRSGRTLSGRVERIDPISDPATREMTVYISFASPPEDIVLQQEARVSIRAGEKSGLLLPRSCLAHHKGESGVMLMQENRAKFLQVEVGPSRKGRFLVLDGLNADSRVILNPSGVSSGDRVEIGRET